MKSNLRMKRWHKVDCSQTNNSMKKSIVDADINFFQNDLFAYQLLSHSYEGFFHQIFYDSVLYDFNEKDCQSFSPIVSCM